jgi:DNA polymerase-4
MIRKILHIDMDAFYASVEVRDNPKLYGLPVIVGGSPESRAVVCAASYEARKYGIRSAMPCSHAKRLCPQAIFLPPRFHYYREISQEIHKIFHQYTIEIEPVSLDEAWLDVTQNHKNIPSATWIAQSIKNEVHAKLNLICSAGVSYNKFLAKIASDEDKPNGLYIIRPEDASQFLQKMEVKKIPGVGKVTLKKLNSLGVYIGSDLLKKEEGFLTEQFGKMGGYLHQIIRGIDNRPIKTNRERKSISVEHTFSRDLHYVDCVPEKLRAVVIELQDRLKNKNLYGRTLTLKVKFQDFHQITRSLSREDFYLTENEIYQDLELKLKEATDQFSEKRVRLIGVGLSNLATQEELERQQQQLNFLNL